MGILFSSDRKKLNELLAAMQGFLNGDLTKKLEPEGSDIHTQIAQAYNQIVDTVGGVTSEITRVTSEVANEGTLGGSAQIGDAEGAWKELGENVNLMVGKLTEQVRNISEVTTAVAMGDLSKSITIDAKGEIGQLKGVINLMVASLSSFTSEVTRVAKEVGSDGKLGGKAEVPEVSGVWKDLTDNVNIMASNLTDQVRGIVNVVTAVAEGDFTQKLAVEAKGEVASLADTVNAMVDTLNLFADQVTSVARNVGVEGQLGGQAQVPNAAGSWKDLTDNVNLMASNLTNQVRNIAEVTTAVAEGNLTKKITVKARGEIAQLKDTINSMVEQLGTFGSEVTRIAKEVGSDGKLGGKAEVPEASGVWKDLTDNVNIMASNLTDQVRGIVNVVTAVAEGDFTQKLTVEAKGEVASLADTVNAFVDSLNLFADEVTTVARTVGVEGQLGGQAIVPQAAGSWKDLTDNVNLMASNLTNQVRNIAEVTTAVAEGDLSKTISVEAKGEIAQLKEVINLMVASLSSFNSEVTRVAKEVGSDGILGGKADVPNVSGVWKDLTDNVNLMATNLTAQVRNISEVTTAVAMGDLSKSITIDAKGEIAQLKEVINLMVASLSSFNSEVTRVAKEVGSDGILGGKADVPNVSGVWKDLTDNVNTMASNLTDQVRGIVNVVTAVADGDFTQKLTVEAKGEIASLADTVNDLVNSLNLFADEVTTVARTVGVEGQLGGQAMVPQAAGSWKDLTDNVNLMASNLTNQVRNIAEVTTAVARGDLTKKITVEARGEIAQLKDTINSMVEQLGTFGSEVTRIAKEVGSDGILGGKAEVPNVSGVWKDLTDNVNGMASNLTDQVRGIVNVVTAVAEGDFTQKLSVEAKGEVATLADNVNAMVDTLSLFTDQVTSVARNVGVEGQLGGQAQVPNAAGSWKDLTDNVNLMASNLTIQVRSIAEVATAVAQGDLSKSITTEAKGEIATLKQTLNQMVDSLRIFNSEVTRVAKEVGSDGILGGMAVVPNVSGVWKELTENVNGMASNLTTQVRGVAEVVAAVAQGDFSRKLMVEAKGEIAALADTINNMVDTLNLFADQVTNVARTVGVDGELGGQAKVPKAAGSWKELTDNVNLMASNLTNQVRNIAEVTTAVARGDLTKTITVEASGEIARLKDTINSMVAQLGTFGSEVTRIAKEVGSDGKLGGQAEIEGVSGIWKGLTDNVNIMASNLTTQVRAIATVTQAVTEGELEQTIQIDARGELQDLTENVNQMVRSLKDTTDKNLEQDWLKTNLANFFSIMQGQKSMEKVATLIMSKLPPVISAYHGTFYLMEEGEKAPTLNLFASYAYKERKNVSNRFALGEGIIGQCALEKDRILITQVPGDYVKITSSLGEATPLNIIALPVIFEGAVLAVIELASFKSFSDIHILFLEQLTENIGVVLTTIQANMRTEKALAESQTLTLDLQSQQEELKSANEQLESQTSELQKTEEQLRSQQEELQQSNEELEEKANQLSEQNKEVARKNIEVEEARKTVEEKAQQLSITSKYKSEFLSNMSHELRTPLNSLLVLSKLLTDNIDSNLTAKQLDFAKTIYDSGNDLLTLLNDILDLSKIEAGKIEINIDQVAVSNVKDFVERTFAQVANQKGLQLEFKIPKEQVIITTDEKRLQQVLNNLLTNAFKFTPKGSVSLAIYEVDANSAKARSFSSSKLQQAEKVLAFSVIDTGIGVPQEKQALIFEAFQQADGATTRKYGGTGLGLSISREVAQILGGEITLESEPDKGSTFTLYLPMIFAGETNQTDAGQRPQFAALTQNPPLKTDSGDELTKLDLSSLINKSADKNPLVKDDLATIKANDRVLLIIEDDLTFAQTLMTMAHEQNFKAIIALDGETGWNMAREYRPDGITLDIQLPSLDGWTVLDLLKHDPLTRHIPVHVVSIIDDPQRALKQGAISYLEKPVSKELLNATLKEMGTFIDKQVKSLLIVEDDEVQQQHIRDLIGSGDVISTVVGSAADALVELKKKAYDCMVLDLMLPDMSGLELLEEIKKQGILKHLPVIVYTAKDLSPAEERELKKLSDSIVLKSARSPERLLAETTLFLHRVEEKLPDTKKKILQSIHPKDDVLSAKTILVVDDDLRNIFTITSLLEHYNMKVLYAEGGKDGIEQLKNNPEIDLVLMDIMMPGMDGYETMQRIRKNKQYQKLPIIALTAKAMKGDREKCLEAGASDYITKPVETDRLLSLLRVWLYQK